MKIQFKDYTTNTKVSTELTKGEIIEYNGQEWRVTLVAKTMCRLTPHGHNGLPMWEFYERLFNF